MTLRAQVQVAEQLRLMPYLDCCGKPWRACSCVKKGALTIGWGHNLDAHGIPKAMAEVLLDDDLTEATHEVDARLTWAQDLSAPRRAVLIDMAFNMGIGGLLGFTNMLTAAERGDPPAVAREMRDSRWYQQVGARAERLVVQWLTDKWQ